MESLQDFFRRYPYPRGTEILQKSYSSAASLIESFFAGLGQDYQDRLFVIIDEYDPWGNAVLSAAAEDPDKATPGTAFLTDFFLKIKTALGGFGPVDRLFVCGSTLISPFSLTDSYFPAVDLSSDPQYAGLFGLTEKELRCLIRQQLPSTAHSDTNHLLQTLKSRCGGYRFSPCTEETVFNITQCLAFLKDVPMENSVLQRTLITLFRLSDPDAIRDIIDCIRERKPINFGADALWLPNLSDLPHLDQDRLLTALYGLGCITLVPGNTFALTVPNDTAASALQKAFDAFDPQR